ATGSNADNSQTTATFSTGTSLTLIIDDQPEPTGTFFVNAVRPYSVMEDVELYQAIVAGVVPEPTAIAFVTIAGAVGVGVGARRRRSG
ncbi:MAG: PEP-CTERM sorting domain-containing protein, partial [Planctomycetota bacterium]